MRQDTRMRGTARGISVRALGHSYGPLRTLDGLDLEVPAHGVLGLVGPSGLRQVDAAGAGLRAARPRLAARSRSARRAADARLASCAFMPQRDVLFPWLSAIDNAALALRNRGASRSRGPEAGRRAVRPLRPRRLRAGATGRALGRHAPAGRLPAHPALREAGAGPRRAVRLARRDHPRRDAGAGWRPPWSRSRGPSILVTHDVEEALYLCDRVAVLSARPARIVEELAAPAPRAGRPRRGGHRPGVRRRPRAGDAGPARGSPMRRVALAGSRSSLALVGLWQIAASTGALADVLNLEAFLVPSPARNRQLALGEPRAARRKRLGDAEGDPARLRSAAWSPASPSPSRCTSRGPSAAPSTRCSSPRRRSRSSSSPRSSSSGSATGSARSWSSSP